MTVSIKFITGNCMISVTSVQRPSAPYPLVRYQGAYISIDNVDRNKLTSLLKIIRVFSNHVAFIPIC